jgi:hypothetical protein
LSRPVVALPALHSHFATSHAPIDNLIKTLKMFQMPEYKRNQIEEAISRVLEPRSQKPTAEMRTRLKRLLETDRALGRVPRSINPERANYAFYSAEAPGSGVEVWFSEYEAFALLNGLRLMAHGWPQGFAASVMRRVRPELERQHARILKQDAKPLFDQEAIRRNAKAGDMAFDNTDPVLLTIVSTSGVAPNEQGEPHRCAICRGPQEAMKFAWEASTGAGAWTMFELATVAHKFSNALGRTEPRHRGRG